MIDAPSVEFSAETSGFNGPSNGSSSSTAAEEGFNLSERYGKVISTINETLNQVDWNVISKLTKAIGILLAVIVIQVLIKGVIDTVNLLPIIPGLLELLGLVVAGRWCWNNLSTGDKRTALLARIQKLRQEYLG